MKLSIITINRNDATGLKKTLDSVLMQKKIEFEHIVIDGASTDDSVDIIKQYEKKASQEKKELAENLKWISEPDSGIYNAMNKGLYLAEGEYTLMLNSGDYFIIDNIVDEIFPFLSGEEIIQGNIVVQRKNGYFIHKGYAHSELSFMEIIHGDFPHQSTFIKKQTLEKYGYYDESYKYISDTLFFLKSLGIGNSSFKYIDKTIVYFDPNGASVQNSTSREIERKRMYKENIPDRLLKFCLDNEKKICLYERLHSNRLIWYIVLMFDIILKKFQKHKCFEANKYTSYKGNIKLY